MISVNVSSPDGNVSIKVPNEDKLTPSVVRMIYNTINFEGEKIRISHVEQDDEGNMIIYGAYTAELVDGKLAVRKG